MKNITINKKRLAAMCAAAALMAPVARVTAMTANAAENGAEPLASANTGIVLNAAEGNSLSGHTFTVYQLGKYGAVQNSADGSTVDSVEVLGDEAMNTWAQSAIDAWNAKTDDDVTIPLGYDAAGAIAKTEDETALRGLAAALANSDAKPAAVFDQEVTGNTYTVDVPDGVYLVCDSNGAPMIVGTKIGGKDLTNQALGVWYVKSKSIPVEKITLGSDGQTEDTSASVGDTVTQQVKVSIPNNMNGAAKTLKFVDAPTNMQFVKGSLKASVKGEDVTSLITVHDTAGETVAGDPTLLGADGSTPADPDLTVPDGGFVADATALLNAHPNEQVTITYQTVITGTPATNDFTASAAFPDTDGGNTWTPVEDDDDATVNAYSFDLKKTAQSDTTRKVSGAGFKIQKKDGAWLKFDAATGMWSDAASQDDATEFFTGDTNYDGKVDSSDDASKTDTATFKNLGDGTYVVKETTAPAGFKADAIALPSFEATITEDGTITFAGADLPALTTDNKDDTVTVADIESLTQLPQTGGVWTIASFAAAAAVMAGLAFGVGGVGVRKLREANKPASIA